MTDDRMDLQALLGKSPDADFLREMIGFAARRPMELEIGGLTGAGAVYPERLPWQAVEGGRRTPSGSPGAMATTSATVSRLCQEIDERVTAFLERPIEGDWPYLWIDATCLKVRQAGRIVSVAVTIAVGMNGDGRRARCSAWRSARRRQRPSGPTSCATWRGVACAA